MVSVIVSDLCFWQSVIIGIAHQHFFKLAMVEKPMFAVGISMISIIVSDI